MKTAAATLQKFAETAEAVARTSKRNEKIRLIGELLTSLELSDASLAAQYLTGRAFPQHEERVAGVGGMSLMRAVAKAVAEKEKTSAKPIANMVISAIWRRNCSANRTNAAT